MAIKDRVINSYKLRFSASPKYLAMAPGRVNLLGEHVDFNDGFVLPAAIDLATYIAFSPTNSSTEVSTIHSVDYDEEVSFTPTSILNKKDNKGALLPGWAKYPAGTLWALSDHELQTPSINASFASDVPSGAGLSSSASVEMAFAIAWSTVGGWSLEPMQLALLGQLAENNYVGVNCGIMDQFASACGVKNKLLFLDCRSLEWKTIPIPNNISIIIADTMIRRSLSNSEYNERRRDCERGVEILSKHVLGISSLRDVDIYDFYSHKDKLPPVISKRVQHVVEEIVRVQKAILLLEGVKLLEFGQLMSECHVSLRDLYEVSITELDLMVEIAQNLPGYIGARLTGAGFGGCTVNLVYSEYGKQFAKLLTEQYKKKTGVYPNIYISHASNGARLLS